MSDSATRLLLPLHPQSLRVRLERDIVSAFRTSGLAVSPRAVELANVALIRRELLAHALRLSESMAPELYARARQAARCLDVTAEIEIYQADGPENAAVHLIPSPVVLEAQGRLLALLDEGSTLALFGHELGHFLVHGPGSPDAELRPALARILRQGSAPAAVLDDLRVWSMACELTADRFALLACGDLDAFLRLEMITTTGLHAASLTWDTQAYLAQCKELIGRLLASGDVARGMTHPEHSVRAYAAWLFSETKEFHGLRGLGPATRTLVEVDQELSRILRRPFDHAVVDIYEPTPPEAHQCALAAAVLVASADGVLSDDEIAVIERTFGDLVNEWRRYLDLDTAQTRFGELAAIVTALGEGPLRSLFAVLTHVSLADDQISQAEISMLLAIGERLQAEMLFSELLATTLVTLGLSIDLASVEKASVPIPVSARDAAAALDTFLRNISDRGTRVTPRRLLRLAGFKDRQETGIRMIEEAVDRARIVASPALSFQELDAAVTLTRALPSTRSAGDTKPIPSADRLALIKAIGRLRDDLVGGDGRSPSVRLREPRIGRVIDLHALEGISTGLTERSLASIRAHKPTRLFDAALEPTMVEAKRLGQAIVALDREHRSRLEDTGTDDLYAGYPLLAGVIDGWLVRGPLVLYPVKLNFSARGVRSYVIEPKEEPPFVNQSLLRAVFHRRKLPLAESLIERLDELAAEPGDVADAILTELKNAGIDAVRPHTELRALSDDLANLERAKNLFEVGEHAVLGLFPQSSSTILQEYDTLLAALESGSQDLNSLLGAASLMLPESLRPLMPVLPPQATPPRPCIVADPSQRVVMQDVRKIRGLVVDGPPGTGKSQVIANLIGDALARGERVAVVCEKRAALDVVVQRLDRLGLRPLLGLVHDVHDDRKALYAQVADRLERDPSQSNTAGSSDGRSIEVVEAELSRCVAEMTAFSDTFLARAQPEGPTLGALHQVASSFADLSFEQPNLTHLNPPSLVSLADQLVGLRAYADLINSEANWRQVSARIAITSLAALTSQDLSNLTQLLAAAAEATQKLHRFDRNRLPLVRKARQALATAHSIARSLESKPDQRILRHLARLALAEPQEFKRLESLNATLQRTIAAAVRVPEPIRTRIPDGFSEALITCQGWASKWTRFFSPAFWKARSVVMSSLPGLAPKLIGKSMSVQALDEISIRYEAAQAWESADQLHVLATPDAPVPNHSDALRIWLQEINSTLSMLKRLFPDREALHLLGAWPDQDVSEWRQSIEAHLLLLSADHQAAQARSALAAHFSDLTEQVAESDLRLASDSLRRDGLRIADADRLIDQATLTLVGRSDASARANLFELFDQLSSLGAGGVWSNSLFKSWALQCIAVFEMRSAQAKTLADDAEAQVRRGQLLAELEDQRAQLALDRIWAASAEADLIAAALPAKRQRRSELQATREEILRETKKQRRLMPLRSFVHRFAPRGLLDVLPVWLVSPETMVTLFPAQPLFDLVIFDEASQCTVANGFPVLLRAKRFVVAGDDKQMPPSSFFTSKSHDDELDDEADTDAVRDRTMLEEESLLTLAAGRLPRRSLAWHYRCRHESLIAFSNAAFYDGMLKTVPAIAGPASQPPIRWIGVDGATYDQGFNRVEAERVVAVLAEILDQADAPTVGVVSFNLKQRSAILDAIDARRSNSPTFAALWDRAMNVDDLDSRPFVKNLEQVQGDERDVIVFSLGHAPVRRTRKDGREVTFVPARFGPLGLRGGERRLNVAISRARQSVYIVSSFEPHFLNTAHSKNAGPALFKDYLEYVHHIAHGAHARAQRLIVGGRAAVVNKGISSTAFSLPGALPLHIQIAEALKTRGIRHELQVGSSEFRVPVAIYARGNDHQFRLALLTEDGTEACEPFEAHVHLRRVLEQRGWSVLRVTSADWHRRPDRVLQRIEASL